MREAQGGPPAYLKLRSNCLCDSHELAGPELRLGPAYLLQMYPVLLRLPPLPPEVPPGRI